MCGIVAILNVKQQTQELRQKVLCMSQKIRHRGPDWSGIYCGGSAVLGHERLSIVDPESGRQPLFSPDGKQVLAVNGEIYNHQEIRRKYADKYCFLTGSDCEVILALYRDKGIDFLEELSGIFAFVLYDEERDMTTCKAEEWINDQYGLNRKKNKLARVSGKFRRKTVDRVDYLFNRFKMLLQK